MLAVPVDFSLPQTKGNAGVVNYPYQAVVMLSLCRVSGCHAVPVYFSLPQTKGNAGVLNCSHQTAVMLSLCHVSGCHAVPAYFSPTDQRGTESGAAGKPRGSPQCFSETSLQCLCLSREFLSHPSLPSSLPEPLEGPHIFFIMPTIAVLWLSEIHTL